MRKLPLIAALILFLFTIAVYADPGFEITEDSVSLSGTHNQPLSSSFTVRNTGTTDLAINFTATALASGSNQLYVSSLSNITNITPGTSKTVSFSVVVPEKQRPGMYTGTLTATSGSLSDTATINVDITHSPSVSTVSKINLGHANLNGTYTKTFDITNTGNDDITDVDFDFSDSDFDFVANKTGFTLPLGGTETIKFNITIPADSSTGNVTLGYVSIDSAELDTRLFDISAEVGGGLEIEDLDVSLSTRKGDSASDTDVSDGNKLTFEDELVGPGSELTFSFGIENTFTDDDGIDINDIAIRLVIEEIDDGSDIEQESEEFNLDTEQSEDIDVIVDIPLSVDQGVYDIFIEVLGEDDNGNEHKAEMSIKLDIDKETREVIISEASLFPEKVKCVGSSTLTATIKNLGRNAEPRAKLEITNKDLGINFAQKNIELEEDPFDGDDEFTKRLPINIGKNTKAGTYPIEIKAYLQEEILWETKTVSLAVDACSAAEETGEGDEGEETEVTEEINETETVEAGQEEEEETSEGEEIPILGPSTTTEVSFTQRPVFWFFVVTLNIIIIAVIAFLVAKLIGKRQ
ncbi:hypothetical protein KY347_06200 [Candidatus Woesearchaeota archaeon]|nr:hypothetical protein [Candidatus Woesearchaeota archaeon]